MNPLHELAHAVGLSIDWEDAAGQPQRVRDDSLEAVLFALGYPAGGESEIRHSLARRAEEAREAPAFVSTDIGAPLQLGDALAHAREAELVAEDGQARHLAIEQGVLPAIAEPGYCRLRIDGREIALAVAPPTCLPVETVCPHRAWGPAAQIPALRDNGPQGYGHFGHLARTAERFARLGADALAISPVHALYPGDGGRYSPYSPSSRQFLNVAFADPGLLGLGYLPPQPEPELIDWAAAIPAHLAALRQCFAELPDAMRAEVSAWAAAGGEPLRRHALYNTLYARFRPGGAYGWQGWPSEFHDPAGEAARRFAAEHAGEIEFQIFAQWLTHRGLATAQNRAREAGMAIGLIADLAVGVDPGGSDAWGMRDMLLPGLTIGAPPDPLGPDGQGWGLTGFSPEGLSKSAFRPWLEMLRAALGPCAGLRIDHAFGLRRLWVIPQGGSAREGVYLAYPFEDMLRLLALESHRARAIIVAEDLGTRPSGFRAAMVSHAMLGMRVLWFERDHHGDFAPPGHYDPMSLAMTSTHDLPTVAGWWRGRDIDWSWRLGRASASESREADEQRRGEERGRVWAAIGRGEPQPAPDDTPPAVDAAVRSIAEAGSHLAILPLEDLFGLDQQPNLPGTIEEHPNWRRRLPERLETMLEEPRVRERIAALDAERKR
jgi:4-alpha-glucanotransferase